MNQEKTTNKNVGFLSYTAFPLLLLGALALVIVAAFFGYFIYDQITNNSNANAKLRVLQNEFAQISPPPDDVRIRHGSMHKTNQGDVGSDYKSSKSFEEIRMHYDHELKTRGWEFVKEDKVKIWRQDFGGKQVFYCKGGNTATLEYSGAKEAEFGWTYSFGLSWGLFEECN
jgi:hypothetical protein